MLFAFIIFCRFNLSFAQPSHLQEIFLSASGKWLNQEKANSTLERELINILEHSNLDKKFLFRRLQRVRLRSSYPLDATPLVFQAPLNLQLIKLDVLNPYDDVMQDDIYLYFFITDGLHTTGLVTNIYRGLGRGESVLFKAEDRWLYPLGGSAGRTPQGAFIVDYGLVESDGDDIQELKKLTHVIIELAAIFYSSSQPSSGGWVLQLRAVVMALADALLSGDHDDELVASSWILNTEHLTQLNQSGYVNILRKHGSNHMFNSWKYRLTLRLQQ